jgi:hypothetical protein
VICGKQVSRLLYVQYVPPLTRWIGGSSRATVTFVIPSVALPVRFWLCHDVRARLGGLSLCFDGLSPTSGGSVIGRSGDRQFGGSLEVRCP